MNRLIILLLISIIGGCTQVSPWQRGHLAQDNMQGEPIEQKAALDQHIYFSKEGASGGGRSAGGGCGCN